MTTLKDKIVYTFNLFILVFLGLFLVYLAYLFFKPFTPPSVTPYPIPIANPNKIVHYGEAIQTKVRSCTYDAVPVTASMRYQNSEGRFYLFASHDAVGVVGCKDSQQNRDPVPSSLEPGKYIIYVTAVFHVTALKDVTKTYQTEQFTLEASPSGGTK